MPQFRRIPLCLALCAAFPSAALAQETAEKILQTVKVTAARADGFVPTTVEAGSFRGADIMEVPSTVNVVTREAVGPRGRHFDGLQDFFSGLLRQRGGWKSGAQREVERNTAELRHEWTRRHQIERMPSFY